MVVFGQSCYNWAKVVLFGQKWLYSVKWFYSGKNCCNREKKLLYSETVVVFGQRGCIGAKVAVFGQNGRIFA